MSSYAVKVFSTMEEARVVQSLLVAHGIPAELDCAYHAQNDWLIIHALGGIRLLVPRTLANEASYIIREANETAQLTLESDVSSRWNEKRNKRRIRRLSLPLNFFGVPQSIVILTVLVLLHYNVIEPPTFDKPSFDVIVYEEGDVHLPPPAPNPRTWDQGYHIGRSYIFPGLDQLIMFGLLGLAFSNFERARRNKYDPPRRV
jgi:hypothetical protein